MFRNRVVARKVCLLAGVDSTLPMLTSAINHNWRPESIGGLVNAYRLQGGMQPLAEGQVIIDEADVVHSLVNRDVD